jgi:hypothetical protein
MQYMDIVALRQWPVALSLKIVIDVTHDGPEQADAPGRGLAAKVA